MSRHYAAALHGTGFLRALKRLWSTRFAGIRAIVIMPDTQDKLELSVNWNASTQSHQVQLVASNWRTGEKCNLYAGSIACTNQRPSRNIRD